MYISRSTYEPDRIARAELVYRRITETLIFLSDQNSAFSPKWEELGMIKDTYSAVNKSVKRDGQSANL